MYICTNNSKCMYSTLYFLTYILQKKLVYLKTIMLCIHMHGTTLKQSWKQGSKDSHPKWLIFYGNKWLYSMTRNIQEIRSIWNQETKTHAKKKMRVDSEIHHRSKNDSSTVNTHSFSVESPPIQMIWGFVSEWFFLPLELFSYETKQIPWYNYVIIGCFFGVVSW